MLHLVAAALVLAPGYHRTAHGCVTNGRGASSRQMAPAQNLQSPQAQIKKQCIKSKSFPSLYPSCAGDAYLAHGQYATAAQYYQQALQLTSKENVTPGTINLSRLSYSIALYRAHNIPQTKAQWRTLLNAPAGNPAPAMLPGTADALAGRFSPALAAYAKSAPAPSNPIEFQDSGASGNFQRALNAAAAGNVKATRTYLNYSLECSPDFEAPHLLLGVIAAMNNDFTTARHEWLAVLQNGGAQPGDTADVLPSQFDAIRLLLRYD